MKVLLAPTEDFIKRERTALSAAAAAGSSVTIAVVNGANFSINDYVVIGQEGSLVAEMQQVTAVTATSITVATLSLAHDVDEPVTQYRYNNRKFYGSVTSTGSYTELTAYGSPAQIDVNNPQGTYLEYTGTEGYLYFKSTYWNTTTTTETDINDATAVLADESTRYTSLYAIRVQAGLTENPYIDDGQIEIYRKRAENEINSYIYQRYVLPLQNMTTQLPEVPFIIENCCMLLAAGYADYREFGKDGEGIKWLSEARSLLKAVRLGTQRLIGSDSNELVLKSQTHGVQSYPNTRRDTKFGMDQNF
jgi:phage gp36-like protein